MKRVFFYLEEQLMTESGYYELKNLEPDTMVYVGIACSSITWNREEIINEYSDFTQRDNIFLVKSKEHVLEKIKLILPEVIIDVTGKMTVEEKNEIKRLFYKSGKTVMIRQLEQKRNTYRESSCTGNTRCDLQKLMTEKNFLRIIEASNPLAIDALNDISSSSWNKEFDGFWSSSLCDSLSQGKADMELLSTAERIGNVRRMCICTNKPIFYDIDSGGRLEQFTDSIVELYEAGVSAVVIEDKIGSKINSLVCKSQMQRQDSIENFSNKIKEGKKVIQSERFWLISRIESLILGEKTDQALRRAEKYIEAGSDAILIHYNNNNVENLVDFIQRYNNNFCEVPLAVIPTMYSYVKEKDLIDLGCKMVIYANHMTRASFLAMQNVARNILKYERALEASLDCLPVSQLMNLEKEKREKRVQCDL